MFTSITWEFFVTALVAAIGSYYGITTLLLYHREIIQWIKSSGQQPVAQTESTGIAEPSHAVMGGIQKESTQELRSSVAAAEEIYADTTDEEPETVTSPEASSQDTLLIGSVADLLQEVKTLSQLLAEYKSDKAEGESLFRTLLLRYPHLRSTTYRDAINFYIVDAGRQQFSFDLSSSEVNAWWEEERPSKK
ncbi:hypothetical protein [Ohtaekwangia koreensis]|uniref:Uncharacterized protein n=1 Tax=Ohtaekwangia koreensis TaxID=688867 RepID=A0A1T5MA94_9BACT|nr:hypothetical protein [Ohtaekwangia koreensis]SKC85152.1 hypothetical protein SAMN05660236_4836 [Ohtaekwangia koreensis]